MAYDEETGQYMGFHPEYDDDDRDKLNQAAEMKEALHRLDQQEAANHLVQRDANAHLGALNELGMTPQEYQARLSMNPDLVQQVKEEAIFLGTKQIVQRLRERRGPAQPPRDSQGRSRDSQGRFTSPQAPAKGKKTAAQFRQQVAERGRISGDSDEAVELLEALLREG